jgi:ArsR family transcriptional regulator
MMNIKTQSSSISTSALFQILSVSPRLEILQAIGTSETGEACVCHLEAALGYRQAYISQHLMALREVNLLKTRRDGRFIYYRLSDRRILEVLTLAGEVLGQPQEIHPMQLFSCECPHCASSTATSPHSVTSESTAG